MQNYLNLRAIGPGLVADTSLASLALGLDFSGASTKLGQIFSYNSAGGTTNDFRSVGFTITHLSTRALTVAVPEPSTLLLIGAGLLGLAASRRRVAS